MRQTCAFMTAVLLVVNVFIVSAYAQKNSISLNYGKIPLAFTENFGQYDSQVKFTTSGSGAAMFFTQEGTTFLFHRRRIS
ncbi:hypothetical protein AMJ80_11075, partial [bacterium SM23_31]